MFERNQSVIMWWMRVPRWFSGDGFSPLSMVPSTRGFLFWLLNRFASLFKSILKGLWSYWIVVFKGDIDIIQNSMAQSSCTGRVEWNSDHQVEWWIVLDKRIHSATCSYTLWGYFAQCCFNIYVTSSIASSMFFRQRTPKLDRWSKDS